MFASSLTLRTVISLYSILLVSLHYSTDYSRHRSQEYETEDGPWDPVSGIASVLLGTLSSLVVGASEIPSDVFHALKTKLHSRHNSINKDGSSDTNSIIDSSSLASHEKHPHHHHSRLDHAKQVASHVAEIGLSVPMDLANSLAQGFHNVPKIYQDKTVRPQENVTGMKSGLQGAGKDFTHGIYDGVTGVVTQPFQGAREEGAVGFVKGIGKGIGGLVLKPTAGKPPL